MKKSKSSNKCSDDLIGSLPVVLWDGNLSTIVIWDDWFQLFIHL